MKRKYSTLLALLLLFTLGLTACGGASPAGTAEEFIKAMTEGKKEKVIELCTEDMDKLAEFPMEYIKSMKENDDTFKFEASDFKVKDESDNKATVTFKTKITEKGKTEEEEVSISLIKKDGKWLVSFMG